MDALRWFIDLFVPPMEDDAVKQYLWRWRVAVFGCLSFLAVCILYASLLFEWGPQIIRPASAQAVQSQIRVATEPIQKQLKDLSDNQALSIKELKADRLERIEQQLLWYREKNCTAKTAESKRLYFGNMMQLFQRYREQTGYDWRIPDCKEIGNAP